MTFRFDTLPAASTATASHVDDLTQLELPAGKQTPKVVIPAKAFSSAQ